MADLTNSSSPDGLRAYAAQLRQEARDMAARGRQPSDQLRADMPEFCALIEKTDRGMVSTLEHLAAFYEALADETPAPSASQDQEER